MSSFSATLGRTSSSLVLTPKAGSTTGCGAIVETGAGRADSVSRNGFLETGRPFIEGLGSAGLGGPFRFRKGLLERRGEGRRPGSGKQGCQSVHEQ